VDQSLKKLGVRRSIQRVTLEEWCRGWLGESGSKFLARTTIKDGVVTLEMKHPAWLQELASRKQELLKKVQERFPELAIREAKVLLAKAGTTSKDEG
jgi:predicted nucleic acid-binding Zn ribbon protein